MQAMSATCRHRSRHFISFLPRQLDQKKQDYWRYRYIGCNNIKYVWVDTTTIGDINYLDPAG